MANPIDPTADRVLARREPQHADARGRPAAVREARGGRAQLRPRDVRADARRPRRSRRSSSSTRTARRVRPASWSGSTTSSSTSSTTSGTARCPSPAAIRELLELCSRLHSTRLAWERPLWEAHVIEGLRDGRVAMYTKIHHALVDGVSAMRLLASTLSTDPDERDMPAPWGAAPAPARTSAETVDREGPGQRWARSADADGPDRDGHHRRGGRDAGRAGQDAAARACATRRRRCRSTRPARSSTRTSPARAASPRRTGRSSGSAPIGKATGTTINDVVLAMCSGAMRAYLTELDALPDTTLVSMVPVGLNAKQSQLASAEGGNAVGVDDGASSAPTSPTPPTGLRRSTTR